MAQYAVPLLIASTTVAAYSQYRQGQADAAIARQQQTAARLSAQGKEIERRRNLLRTIAAQNNAAGASGLTPNDQFTLIQENDLRMYDLDMKRDQVMADTNESILGDRASNAEAAGNLGALDTALSGGYTYSLIS